MTTDTVKLTDQGQVPIPRHIREALHWESGARLTIETTAGGILLKPISSEKKLRLEDLRGFLKHSGPRISTEELCKPVNYDEGADTAEERDS